MTQFCDIKIMGVPKRMMNVVRLCTKLGLTIGDTAIDEKLSGNPFKTSRRAFTQPFAYGTTHRCVLQDDVDVCEGFDELVNTLVNLFPDAMFSLYSRKRDGADIPDGSIVRTGGRIWGQCVIIPKNYIDGIYEKYDSGYDGYIHDDGFYCGYAKWKKIPVLTTYPCAVRLLDEDSLLGHTLKQDNGSFGEIGGMSLVDRTDLSLEWPCNCNLKFNV